MDVEVFIGELYEYIEIQLKTLNSEDDTYSSERLVLQLHLE